MAEAAIEALKGQLAQLEKDRAKDQQLLILLQDKLANPKVPSIKVSIPREPRLRRYAGGNPQEWIGDAKCVLTAQSDLSTKERVDFLKSHLDGSAKIEIECRNVSAPEEIFDALQLVFGPRSTPIQLTRSFYECQQQAGQTITDFSHELVRLIGSLEKSDAAKVSNKDLMLREQFVAGILDSRLRWELKKQVGTHSSITFIDVRETAMQYAAEVSITASKPKTRPHQEAHLDSIRPEEDTSSTLTKMMTEMMVQHKALMDRVDRQQSCIDQLLRAQQPRQHEHHKPDSFRSKPPKCENCGKVGHQTRRCWFLPHNEQQKQTQSRFHKTDNHARSHTQARQGTEPKSLNG